MKLAKVPLVPQWNLSSGCICTPEGGFLYVGARSVNYIGPALDANGVATSPICKVFHTRQTINSIDVDPRWGANDEGDGDGVGRLKYFAALAQDNSLQIWDFERECAVSGHKAHATALARGYMEGNGPSPPHQSADRVLLSFMRNRNVLTIDAVDLVIFCVASNTYARRPTFISSRNQQLTVLRASPYNEQRFAVGTNRGLVLVCDLQQAAIVYTLRGHDAYITSLSWTRADNAIVSVTVQVEQQNWRKKPHQAPPVTSPAAATEDIFDIYDYDYLENEFGAPLTSACAEVSQTINESSELGSGSDFVGIEKPKDGGDGIMAASTKFDFAEACQSLKEEIDALKNSEPAHSEDPVACEGDAVTLADCQRATRQVDLSSSCGGDDSTEGSLELIDRSSSEDDAAGVDGCRERKPKQQILHQAEVHHASYSHECLKNLEVNEVVEDKVEQLNTSDGTLVEEAVKAANGIMPMQEASSVTPANLADDNEPVGEILLASAGIDSTFWVWNTETGAACDNMRARYSAQAGKNCRIEVGWLNGSTFLTTGKAGDLSYWSLLPPDDGETNAKPRYKFKEEKRRFMQRAVVSFGICKQRKLLWCVSSHREVSCEIFGPEGHKLVAKYSCASSNISAMRECPDDMNKIALGFSDRRVGIIDISKMSPTNVSIDNFSGRIDSPVLSIVWSPDNKKIAFGTMEGRIGIINVENMKNQPYTFNPICGKPIYSLAWQDNNIYVVCNESIAVYEDTMTKRDPQVINGIRAVSAISLRDNFLFVGTQSGHFQLFRRSLQSKYSYELLQTLDLAPRYITDIAWSPIAREQLAVVANANNIHLLSFNAGMLTQTRRIEIKNVKAANACVKWSNRSATSLLTCGFDGAVRVWDLTNATSNTEQFLKQFHCPMTCGLFLPTDENVVVCAGKSTSIEMFDMRIEKSEDYSRAKWKRHSSNAHVLDSVQWAQKAVPSTRDVKTTNAAEKRRQRRAEVAEGTIAEKCKNISLAGNGEAPETVEAASALASSPSTTTAVEDNAIITNLISDLKIKENQTEDVKGNTQSVAKTSKNVDKCCPSSVFMTKSQTLLYLTSKELNKDALEIITFVLNSGEVKHTSTYKCTKLFGTKSQAKELLAEELDNHKHNETKGISSLFMPQLDSNIKEEILKCVQQKRLSEWHVALAPTVSYNFWQKCGQAFADQLVEQGFPLQAATYLIAIHNQTAAIQMLVEQRYFKEALLVAQVYLQPDDPLVNTIVDKWIEYLSFTGNFPGAALLCTLSGQINRAYDTLAKVRTTQPELERVLKLLKTNKKFQ